MKNEQIQPELAKDLLMNIEWSGANFNFCMHCQGLSPALESEDISMRALGHKKDCLMGQAIEALGGTVIWHSLVDERTGVSSAPVSDRQDHCEGGTDAVELGQEPPEAEHTKASSDASAENATISDLSADDMKLKSKSLSEQFSSATTQVNDFVDAAKSNPLLKSGVSKLSSLINPKKKSQENETSN